MPNWTLNRLTVSGPPAVLRDFIAAARAVTAEDGDAPEMLDFDRHVPMPPELLEDRNPPPGVFPAWHTWRRAHWGTKWNAVDSTLEGDPAGGSVTYGLMTANAPPDIWLDRVAKRYPVLRFALVCVEEFLHFFRRMVWEGGRFVLAEDVDPHSLEWLELEGFELD